jgi:DNA polymerase-1
MKVRELFICQPGHSLIDADYSQIEYRLLAHLTKEPILLQAFKEGKDVHEATGKALGVDRAIGKQLNFASIYGAQPKKIAAIVGCEEAEAREFLTKYWQVLPSVTAWVNRIKYQAKQKKGIYTYSKRWIPLPGIDSPNQYERMHWERAAVNYTIQGSAAEILKLAMIKLRKEGYIPLLTVHDELLFESTDTEVDLPKIKKTMETIVMLDVPLEVDIHTGKTWKEAKGE